MKLPKFEYLIPQSLAEACQAAAAEGLAALIIAGGTDLLQALKYGLKKPSLLIDISSLPELDFISYSQHQGLTIGPLVTLRRLAAHQAVRDNYPLLAHAALSMGSTQLQAMGTIGGNICQDTCCIYYNLPPMSRQGLDPCFKLDGGKCHAVKGSKICWATYSGDIAPALLALQAELTIAGRDGDKVMPVSSLFSGRGENPHNLQPGQLVKEIHLPPPGDSQGIYLKLRLRKSIDYPLLGVAVNILSDRSKKKLHEVTLALTAVEKSPLLITAPPELAASSDLATQVAIMADAATKIAHPIANTSGYSPRYRRQMVKAYVAQAIGLAMDLKRRKAA
jgi:4-hydroxybenzoyl-CoA reductase subunit beta